MSIGLLSLAFVCLVGAAFSLTRIVRYRRAEKIWGEIIGLTRLPDKPRKDIDEPEEPDYQIEVRYEYKGEVFTDKSVIKKEVYYAKGDKIRIFLPGGRVKAAVVDYNLDVPAYVMLMIWLALGLLLGLIVYFKLYQTTDGIRTNYGGDIVQIKIDRNNGTGALVCGSHRKASPTSSHSPSHKPVLLLLPSR